MKLFFTIFAAILAAAAVIAVALSVIEQRKRDVAQEVSTLECMEKTAALMEEHAMAYDRLDQDTLDRMLDLVELYRAVLSRGRAYRSEVGQVTMRFADSRRTFLRTVRRNWPEKRDWADRFEQSLDRLDKVRDAL